MIALYFQSVNQSEEQLESNPVIRNNELSDQEKEAEEDDPLVALAPDVPLLEEQSPAAADAFTCPLFQHLDEVGLIKYGWLIIFLVNSILKMSQERLMLHLAAAETALA